jgi:hypothetical protein
MICRKDTEKRRKLPVLKIELSAYQFTFFSPCPYSKLEPDSQVNSFFIFLPFYGKGNISYLN